MRQFAVRMGSSLQIAEALSCKLTEGYLANSRYAVCAYG